MTNLTFLQGLKANLPTSASEGSLLFTTDTGELFKGNGENQPLTYYSSVLYGYENLADLQSKNPSIIGKIYLTQDNRLYGYNGTAYELVSGSTEILSEQVTFDNSDSDLIATNVQDAVSEVYTKLQELRTESENSFGKVKVNESDNLEFLGDKLGTTVVFENGVLTVKNIDGLTVGVSDINTYLTGTTSNIQQQLNGILDNLETVTQGLNYLGRFDTVSDLEAVTDKANGNLAVVSNVDGDGGSELYIYSEVSTQWQKIGKFEFSETFIGLKDTPSAYSNGKFLKSTATGIEFTDVNYSDIQGVPNVAIEAIEDAVEKVHEHNNKAVLDKFSENVDGEVEYNGSPLSVKWESFQI